MPKIGMKEIRMEQVIEAAKRCIVTKGLSQMSMKDISEEAGISTGIIYHYFRNKEDLLLQILKTSFRSSHEQVMEKVNPIQNTKEKLFKHIELINRTPQDNPNFYVILVNYLGEAAHNPEIQHIVLKFFNNLKLFMQEYLTEGAGVGKEQFHLYLPTIIYALGLGLGIMWTIDSTAFQIDEMDSALKTLFSDCVM